MEKLEIVKINNQYALRRTRFWFIVDYYDLKSPRVFFWSKQSHYFTDCLGTEEEVRRVVNQNTDFMNDEVIELVK